jgi:Ca2+-transporting ATPase
MQKSNSEVNNWHSLSYSEALCQLGTDPACGLSEQEATRRLAEHGFNELTERGIKSPWRMLWEQLTSVRT